MVEERLVEVKGSIRKDDHVVQASYISKMIQMTTRKRKKTTRRKEVRKMMRKRMQGQ